MLKDLIKEAAAEIEAFGARGYSPRTTSLTVIRATDRQDTAEERFFQRLEAEVDKVGSFTGRIVCELRSRLETLQHNIDLLPATVTTSGAGGGGTPPPLSPPPSSIATTHEQQQQQKQHLLQEAKAIGDEFLQLEKYVNLNYMGFHKALKKHDKMLPHSPCRQFYIAHLHNQPWVQGNYSDLLVLLSSVYSRLRGDEALTDGGPGGGRGTSTVAASRDSAQEEVAKAEGATRTVAKFWVRVADISAVKHHIVQHLPVYQYNPSSQTSAAAGGGGRGGDAELVNSVFLDNSSLELYHARLDKRPNAIMLRLRWWGGSTGTTTNNNNGAGAGGKGEEGGPPDYIWLERKTHRESWRGAETIKETCPIHKDKVVAFLEGEYSPEEYEADLEEAAAKAAAAAKALSRPTSERGAGGGSSSSVAITTSGSSNNNNTTHILATPEQRAAAARLLGEVQSTIDAKQLKPMIRTQYMRTAFQIPFDTRVRVSLDTNIFMMKENPEEGPSCTMAGRWYRDPVFPINRTEITRFPHAVLEMKLLLGPQDSIPDWVQELVDSGLLWEVHKFSKFIHGVAALLPDAVQAVPYWVDDPTVKASMLMSAPEAPMVLSPSARDRVPASGRRKPRKRLEVYGRIDEGEIEGEHDDDGDDDGDDNDLTRPLLPGLRDLTRSERAKRMKKMMSSRFGKGKTLKPFARAIDWWFAKPPMPPRRASIPTPPQGHQPKTVFANERTFLSWLHMAVTMGSISAALLGYTANSKGPEPPVPPTPPGPRQHESMDITDFIAVVLLPIAIVMAGYSLLLFIWRSNELRDQTTNKFIDDRRGPLALAGIVVAALGAIFLVGFVDLVQLLEERGELPPSPSPSPPPLGPPLPPFTDFFTSSLS